MVAPSSCPEAVDALGWKNGSRPAGERCDMRISRVVSWYVIRPLESESEGERGGGVRERWKEDERDASEGKSG